MKPRDKSAESSDNRRRVTALAAMRLGLSRRRSGESESGSDDDAKKKGRSESLLPPDNSRSLYRKHKHYGGDNELTRSHRSRHRKRDHKRYAPTNVPGSRAITPRGSAHIRNGGSPGALNGTPSLNESMGGRSSSRSSSSSSSSSATAISGKSLHKNRVLQYEFEWHEPSFFNRPSEQESPTAPPPNTTPVAPSVLPLHSISGPTLYHLKAEPQTVEHRGSIESPPHQALNLWQLNVKLEKYVLIEVAAGQRQMVELTAAEIIKRVRVHKYFREGQTAPRASSSGRVEKTDQKNSVVGELTYRDIRQIFSAPRGMIAPSIEVRKSCILLCIPPLTGMIFHDRCVFLVNDELETDAQLVKLEEITGTYAGRAGVVERYWTNYGCLTHQPSQQVFAPAFLPPMKSAEIRKTRSKMLFGEDEGDTSSIPQSQQAPRFVLFPLEFAMLEICVTTALSYLHIEITEMESLLQNVSKKLLKKNPSVQRLEDLHALKTPVQSLVDRVHSLSQEFKDLLSNPEDLDNMELTKLFFRPDLHSDDTNPNLEILLEFFDQEIDQYLIRIKTVLRSIDNAERLVTLRLSVTRNKIVFYELAAALLTVGLNFGSCISGVFGMNLANNYEDSNTAFWLSTSLIISCATGGMLFVLIMIWRFKV